MTAYVYARFVEFRHDVQYLEALSDDEVQAAFQNGETFPYWFEYNGLAVLIAAETRAKLRGGSRVCVTKLDPQNLHRA